MTHPEIPYRIPLDPCLNPEHRPASPVLRVGEQQGPEPWRHHAPTAIDAAFTEVGDKLSAPLHRSGAKRAAVTEAGP